MLLLTCDQPIAQQLARELEQVETRFAAELLSDLPCVNALVTHIERYRGKMLRPMLVVTSGLVCQGNEGQVTDAHRVVATVAEMVHMATLVHDDVLDEAQTRRRGATVNYLKGNEAAVMLGDYLISHAYHLCSSLQNQAISRAIADATNTVCEGELLQLANRNNWQLDERTYFEIIRRKTASLCGVCCRLGALLSNASAQRVDDLYQYGEKVGTAFQIVDDVLDLTGDQATVGKTVGLDLDKGKLTLPLIHCLANLSAKSRTRLLELLARFSSELKNGHASEVMALVQSTSSVEYANQWAQRLIAQAKALIEPLPESAARSLMLEMADTVLTRKF